MAGPEGKTVRWEGYVEEVYPDTDSFSARLIDLENETEELAAEIFRSAVSIDDLELVIPGAMFH